MFSSRHAQLVAAQCRFCGQRRSLTQIDPADAATPSITAEALLTTRSIEQEMVSRVCVLVMIAETPPASSSTIAEPTMSDASAAWAHDEVAIRNPEVRHEQDRARLYQRGNAQRCCRILIG